MKRNLLLFVGAFLLGQVAFAVAGWKGMGIFYVAAVFGLVVGAIL